MEVNITNNAVEQFLNDYFYTPYKERNMDGKTLELIFTPQCNLKCSYCYLWKNKNNLFSGCEYNKEKILNNLKLVLKWLEKNHFCPTLDLFSGEFFAQTLGYEALEIIYNHQKEVEPQYRIPALFIPTNMTFLGSDELTAKVDEFRDKFAELDIKLFLSASIDGKYIATNRSYDKDLDIEINLVRDDAYYDKVFDYCVKHNILFHPMIYSKNIENWKDNFLWFKENLEKRGASVWSVYLLEVRNEEWTQTEIKHFQDFVRFLYDLLWEEKGHDVNAFVKQLNTPYENLNILGNFCWGSAFGLSCSVQSSLCIRLEDLQVPPCHRTAYPQFMYGQFVPDDEKVLTFKSQNPELMATILGIHFSSCPYCAECPINQLCLGPCLGSQYESNKNLFVPIPSVCALSWSKLLVVAEKLEEFGAFGKIANIITPQRAQQLEYLRRENHFAKQN